MPLVSIIIPCYNQGIYLLKTLQSVFKQSFTDYEIIIINDGSTCPKTNSLLSTFSYPKTVVYHTENQGVVMARNFAIHRAEGKYILPLDADDLIGPSYLEQALKILEADPEVGIVYSRGEYFGAKFGPMEDIDFSIPQILCDNMIFCSGFFRKDDWVKVGGYNKKMIYGLEDCEFWIRIITLNRSVVRLPACHFYYRIKRKSRNSSLTSEQMLEMKLEIVKSHRSLYINHLEAVFRILLEDRINNNQTLYKVFYHRLLLFLNINKRGIQSTWFKSKQISK